MNILRQYTAVLSVWPGIEGESQLKYLQFLAKSVTDEREPLVVLQIHEIHLQVGVSYKGGTISGAALNRQKEKAQAVRHTSFKLFLYHICTDC